MSFKIIGDKIYYEYFLLAEIKNDVPPNVKYMAIDSLLEVSDETKELQKEIDILDQANYGLKNEVEDLLQEINRLNDRIEELECPE